MSFPKEIYIASVVAVKCDGKDHRKARVGCVIRRRDGALVSARNIAAKHVKVFTHHCAAPECHAEARATKKADVGAVAYVARLRRDGSYGNARPCNSCQAIMRARGIVAAYYTLSDVEWGCLKLR